MNKIIKLTLALFCACVFVKPVLAVDNGTEFGIEDDLTVLGDEGTIADPDAEIAGFAVFGTTSSATMYATGAGDVAIGGDLQVDSTAYFVGKASFTAGAASIFVGGGANGQVLKYNGATGAMQWGADNTGLTSLGSVRRLQMVNNGGDGLIDSLFLQNAGDTNVTMISGSSLTIQGLFEATGNALFGGTLGVTGLSSLSTLGTSGLATLNSASITTTLGVNGNVTLGDAFADQLVVNAQSSFVAGSTFTAGIYITDIASFTAGSDIFIGGGADGQVLKYNGATGAMQWAADDTGSTDLNGTQQRLVMYGATGITESQFIQDAGNDGITMIGTSSMTIGGKFEAKGNTLIGGTLGVTGLSSLSTLGTSGLATLNSANVTTTLGVTGAATLSSTLAVNGNSQLGNDVTDINAINGATEADVALVIHGDDSGSTKYTAKFYSGADLAAWVKKK